MRQHLQWRWRSASSLLGLGKEGQNTLFCVFFKKQALLGDRCSGSLPHFSFQCGEHACGILCFATGASIPTCWAFRHCALVPRLQFRSLPITFCPPTMSSVLPFFPHPPSSLPPFRHPSGNFHFSVCQEWETDWEELAAGFCWEPTPHEAVPRREAACLLQCRDSSKLSLYKNKKMGHFVLY